MYAYVSRLDVCINRKWGALQQFQIKWVVLLLLLLRRRRRRSKYNHLAITPPSLLVFQETFQPDRSDYVKSFFYFIYFHHFIAQVPIHNFGIVSHQPFFFSFVPLTNFHQSIYFFNPQNKLCCVSYIHNNAEAFIPIFLLFFLPLLFIHPF